jgi:ubiquinone/menaquinone biosynthesis C-methylase UbiE
MNLARHIDWQNWIERYDKMQRRYLVKRSERFDIIAGLIKAVCPNPRLIVDLGCGTGSLSIRLLEEFDSAKLYAVDLDPTILLLAEHRLKHFKNRVQIIQADAGKMDWGQYIGADAVVSATALHWLKPEDLEKVYCQIYKILRSGGIFMNADHAGSSNNLIQQRWEFNREQMRQQEQTQSSEDWDGFWKQFLCELGDDAKIKREKALGQWQGIEDGMPLQWHFQKLEQCGFEQVDCFWRCDCDAIYGAIKQ